MSTWEDWEFLIKIATPMTDEERNEQAASFAFGQLALTKEWQDKSAPELAELRETCRRLAGCKP